MIFDTHAHYDDEAFDIDRETLLEGLPGQGIGAVVNVGASMRGAEESWRLMQKYDFVYGAIGIHPDHAGEMDEEKMQRLREMLAHPKAVAVGEIGLDYYWDKESHEIRKNGSPRRWSLRWKWRSRSSYTAAMRQRIPSTA